MKKIISTIVSAVLILSIMVPLASAVSIGSYSYNGINAYQHPGQVANGLNVDSVIIATTNANNAPAVPEDFDVKIVSTPTELTTEVENNPFAAIIIMNDCKTDAFRDTIVNLSETYHLILMMQTDESNETEQAEISLFNLGTSFDPCYAVYYVDNGELTIFDVIPSNLANSDNFGSTVNGCMRSLLWHYNGAVNCVDEIANATDVALLGGEITAYATLGNFSSCIFESNFQNHASWTSYIYSNSSGTGNSVAITTGTAIIVTGDTVTNSNYDHMVPVNYWSGSTLKSGWLMLDFPYYGGLVKATPINLKDYSGSPDDWYTTTYNGVTYVGIRLKNSAGMYNSSGTLIKTLGAGSWVFLSSDALCGYNNPHYFTINGASPWGGSGEAEGPQGFEAYTSTTFVNGGFNSSSYNIYTE